MVGEVSYMVQQSMVPMMKHQDKKTAVLEIVVQLYPELARHRGHGRCKCIFCRYSLVVITDRWTVELCLSTLAASHHTCCRASCRSSRPPFPPSRRRMEVVWRCGLGLAGIRYSQGG